MLRFVVVPLTLIIKYLNMDQLVNGEMVHGDGGGGPSRLFKLRQMGTQRVQMKGVLPWLFRWAHRAGTIDFCHAFAALVGPVQNIFSLPLHYFKSFVPSPSKLGGQSCRVACLLMCVSGVTSLIHTL